MGIEKRNGDVFNFEGDFEVRKMRLKRNRGREIGRATTILQCSKEARKKEEDGVSVGIKTYGGMTAEAS